MNAKSAGSVTVGEREWWSDCTVECFTERIQHLDRDALADLRDQIQNVIGRCGATFSDTRNDYERRMAARGAIGWFKQKKELVLALIRQRDRMMADAKKAAASAAKSPGPVSQGTETKHDRRVREHGEKWALARALYEAGNLNGAVGAILDLLTRD